MKNAIAVTFMFLFHSLLGFAQFEGTIVWNFKMEVTDEKLKGEIDKASQYMNSPEIQAQMKLLEEKMNDPQFKAVLDQNPEMKAMIESQLAAMKSGNSSGNVLDNMMPKKMETKIKNGNSISKVEGGAFESEVLYLKSKDIVYHIDRKEKTYSILPKENESKDNFTVTKTEEFSTVQGYKCRKYIVEGTEQGQKITSNVWATTEIKDLDPHQFSNIRIGKGNNASFLSKIEGLPIKTQINMAQGYLLMEVASIQKGPIDNSLFELPKGFTEKKKP